MTLHDFLSTERWELVHATSLPAIEARLTSFHDLAITENARKYLTHRFPAGVYEHQRMAIQCILDGKHVCLTTGTASGKSLPFLLTGIEFLSRTPGARILAIYPMKALAKEQEERWRKALDDAGLAMNVGRIDGQVPMQERVDIVQRSQVLVMTPDVMHAWLFSQLSVNIVRDFLMQVSLIVVDEVHTYTGVFGSNSAFLLRRLRHVLKLLGCNPVFVCASATIADSTGHLLKLFGLNFQLIDQSCDTSPRQPIKIDLVRPPLARDFLTATSSLLSFLARVPSSRFIAFVDSRKQTELIASIVSREKEEPSNADYASDDDQNLKWDHLQQYNVLPYRAGYEEQDRLVIQERLTAGTLAGVVSTSALELGIDIPHLTVGVLVGVPYSSTSFFQRIGRIGRHSPGHVLVISRGNVFDETLFSDPDGLLKRPLAEGALYLENQRIQYIHTLCIARHGGEHDQILAAENHPPQDEFGSEVDWPEGFLTLCAGERVGEVASELQPMKSEAGDDPNHAYPLRDVEVQFKVQHRIMGEIRNLGQLSYSQLMREAYPGAVYYYTGLPYRVTRVNTRSREVQVRREKKYSTSPKRFPILVFPNFAHGNIFGGKAFGELACIECNLQVRDAISGYSEQRGPNKLLFTYPIDSRTTGVFFDQQRFSRNYFTTGVIVTHPVLNKSKVDVDLMSVVLFEAFLMIIPFERRDVNFAVDKHRMRREQFGIEKDSRFIAIYDQTYGSLRLTSRLLDIETLRLTLKKAVEILSIRKFPSSNTETIAALECLLAETMLASRVLTLQAEEEVHSDQTRTRVLLPGSRGLAIQNNNKEFIVEGIFFDVRNQRLSYRGRYTDHRYANETTISTLPVEWVVEVPDESSFGYYSWETGEIRAA